MKLQLTKVVADATIFNEFEVKVRLGKINFLAPYRETIENIAFYSLLFFITYTEPVFIVSVFPSNVFVMRLLQFEEAT